MSDEKENSNPDPEIPMPADKTEAAKVTSDVAQNGPADDTESSVNSGQGRTTTIAQYISLGLLLGVIALFSFLFYEVMAKFLVPLFLAALLVVMFRPIHDWIDEKCGGREKLAALLTTSVVLLVVLVPIGLLLILAAFEGRQVVRQFSPSQVVDEVSQIRTNLGLDMPVQKDLRAIDKEILDLQQNAENSAAVHDQHRTSLYMIEESAKSLAKEQNLEWPEVEQNGDEEAADSESAWVSFVTSLNQARRTHSRMDLNGQNEENDDLEQEKQYQDQIKAMAGSFIKFRTELLGGKARAAIIQLVNPSTEEADAYINEVVEFLRDKVLKLSSAGAALVGNLVLSTAIMIIGLYFFLLDGPKMIETFKGLSPIDDSHEQELVAEFSNISRAVVLATLLSALAQGLLAGIGFYFAGLDSVFLLMVLSAVLAMVPFVGAAAVWVPCALYLYFVDHNLTAAIGLAIYGVAIISMADNIIKPYVLHGQSNIHPLFALLSVLGGVTTLGPIGILVGPMVVAFLQTLLKILQREMKSMDGGTTAASAASQST